MMCAVSNPFAAVSNNQCLTAKTYVDLLLISCNQSMYILIPFSRPTHACNLSFEPLFNYICTFSLERFINWSQRTNATVLTTGGFRGFPKQILNGNEAIYLSSCAAH